MQLRATRLTAIASAVRRLFSPSSLFASGEQGAWYDPSDFNRYMSQLGPELVPNGTFDANVSGWTANTGYATITWEAGAARFIGTFAEFAAMRSSAFPTVVGKTYVATVQVLENTGALWILSARNSSDVGIASSSSFSGPAIAQVIFTATTTQSSVHVRNATGATTNRLIDNISVRELTALETATLFQDSAGTTPVTAVEQPVGLMLDKSKGLVLGGERNGDPWFDSPSYWNNSSINVSVSGGVASWTSAASGARVASTLLTCEAGKWYTAVFDIVSFSSGGLRFADEVGNSLSPDFTSSGVKTFSFLALITGGVWIRSVNTTTASVTSLSVRELPGNHAYQTTSTSRPVLSARYNLLTKTEQFDDAVWSKTNATVTPNAAVAPDGTMTADAITTTNTVNPNVQQAASSSGNGISFRFSLFVRANTATEAVIQLFVNSGSPGVVPLTGWGIVSGPGSIDISSSASGNLRVHGLSQTEWTQIYIVGTPVSAVGALAAYVKNRLSGGAVGDSIYIWGASLVPANQASIPYQRVNTATDYDADPAKFKPYLKFDGVDDFLVTNSIDFTSTDKMTVFAGVRKLSDAAGGVFTELSVDTNVNRSFGVFAPASASATYQVASRLTSVQGATAFGFVSPTTDVVTLTADPAAPFVAIRVDGVERARNVNSQGTGNFGNYPLYIGRRGGTTLPFNGQLYSLIVRGAQTSDTQVSQTETWVNGKTGAY